MTVLADLTSLRNILLEFGIDLLEEWDFDPHGTGGHIFLRRGRSNQLYKVRYIDLMKTPILSKMPDLIERREEILYLGDFISEKSASSFRDLGLQFVDSYGNAHLEFGEVYVDVRGRRPVGGPFRASTSGKGVIDSALNLFSRRRAQVLFVLLTWPEVATWTLREIGEVAGVSLGQVQQTLKQLEAEGFHVNRNSGEILNQKRLFDLWVMNYPRYLSPSLEVQSFRGEVAGFAGDHSFQMGGESAVRHLMRPANLVLYTAEFDPDIALKNRWRRSEEPNIFIRQKFWTEPSSVRKGAERSQKAVVPSTLIYADLIASGESRQREVAEILEDSDDRLLSISRS